MRDSCWSADRTNSFVMTPPSRLNNGTILNQNGMPPTFSSLPLISDLETGIQKFQSGPAHSDLRIPVQSVLWDLQLSVCWIRFNEISINERRKWSEIKLSVKCRVINYFLFDNFERETFLKGFNSLAIIRVYNIVIFLPISLSFY